MSVRSFVAASAGIATVIAGVVVASTASAETSSEPVVMTTFDPELPRPIGSGDLRRVLTYSCTVRSGSTEVDAPQTRVEFESTVPTRVAPGGEIAARDFDVWLTLPDEVGQEVATRLGATAYSGSTPVALRVRAGDQEPVDLPAFEAAASPTPFDRAPWRLQLEGTLPAIQVPDVEQADGDRDPLLIDAPERLLVDGAFQTAAGEVPGSISCTGPADRDLGGTWITSAPEPSETPSTPPTAELARSLSYACRIVSGGLELGTRAVQVDASATYPAVIRPGESLPARDASVDLVLPELVRAVTYDLLLGRTIEGVSTDADWDVTTAGRTTVLETGDLTFDRVEVPAEVNQPWRVPGRTTLPAITVPDDAEGALWLRLPRRFTIGGVIRDEFGSDLPTTFDCAAPADRVLGGIPLEGATNPTPPPTDTEAPPTDPPTTTPTDPTTPTTPPTSHTPVPTTPTPTTPAALTPTVKVAALGLWRSAVFTVGVQAKGVVPTGTVEVKRGDSTVARGRLVLGVAVLAADRLPKGELTFTITYSGDAKVAARTVTKKVRIL